LERKATMNTVLKTNLPARTGLPVHTTITAGSTCAELQNAAQNALATYMNACTNPNPYNPQPQPSDGDQGGDQAG